MSWNGGLFYFHLGCASLVSSWTFLKRPLFWLNFQWLSIWKRFRFVYREFELFQVKNFQDCIKCRKEKYCNVMYSLFFFIFHMSRSLRLHQLSSLFRHTVIETKIVVPASKVEITNLDSRMKNFSRCYPFLRTKLFPEVIADVSYRYEL